jgi:hypothetical protein
MPADGTLPAPLPDQSISPLLAAPRAHEPIRPSTFSQILLASFIACKLRLKFAQGFRKRWARQVSYTTACALLKQPDKHNLAKELGTPTRIVRNHLPELRKQGGPAPIDEGRWRSAGKAQDVLSPEQPEAIPDVPDPI